MPWGIWAEVISKSVGHGFNTKLSSAGLVYKHVER